MKYSQKLEQLLGLGDELIPHDYEELGLTRSDVAELICMATDDDLLSEEEESPSFWASVHAWYALGQLQVLDAVEPLLDQIDKYPYDLLFDQDYPEVFKMIGKGCIPLLGKYLNNEEKSQRARELCCHYLSKMVEEYRSECVEVLSRFLLAENHDVDLNAFVVCSLMNLKAVEAIDIIRQAFQKNLVNIDIPGDLEDVEIALGLRLHRETPRPSYNSGYFYDEDGHPSTIIRDERKIGRNDPCPCGSGKKYKKCCLN